MSYRKILWLLLFFIFTPVLLWSSLYLKYYEIRHLQPEIEFSNVNDLSTERIVFHSFRDIDIAQGRLSHINYNKDTAFAELLIIGPKKVYLIKDGFESYSGRKARQEKYKELVANWSRQRDTQRNLLQFSQAQIKAEQQVGRHSPDYARFGNLILRTLRKEDKLLKSLHKDIGKLKQRLRLTQKYFGKSSGEYEKLEEELEALQKSFDDREETLKKDLRERSIGTWDGPFFPYKDTEEGKELEKEATEVKDDKHIDFFRPNPSPPPLRTAGLHRETPDGFPDYVAIGLPGKNKPSFQRLDSKKENWVKENLGAFYKSIRNKHVQRYANQYKELLLNPYKYNARVEGSDVRRDPLCKIEAKKEGLSPLSTEEGEQQESQTGKKAAANSGESGDIEKASSLYGRIDVYSQDATHYTVIDCNGDGIVESFLVYELGGLYWGAYKDIPNTISIFNNKDPEIQAIIGDLIKIQEVGNTEIFSDFKSKEKEVEQSIEKEIEKDRRLRSLTP